MNQQNNETVTELEVVHTEVNSDIKCLVNNWLQRLSDAQSGHYSRAEKLYFRADLFGYCLILTSTIVTAMLFLNADGWWKIFLTIMSILSASLSGVVSFARFAEKGERHRSAAGCYGKLRRQLEKLDKTMATLTEDEIDSKLKVLRIEWEYISQNAPLTPKSSLTKKPST